jgi:hypothetical protein
MVVIHVDFEGDIAMKKQFETFFGCVFADQIEMNEFTAVIQFVQAENGRRFYLDNYDAAVIISAWRDNREVKCTSFGEFELQLTGRTHGSTVALKWLETAAVTKVADGENNGFLRGYGAKYVIFDAKYGSTPSINVHKDGRWLSLVAGDAAEFNRLIGGFPSWTVWLHEEGVRVRADELLNRVNTRYEFNFR